MVKNIIRIVRNPALYFILCFFSANISAGAEIVDRIVAVVNEDIISLSELNLYMKPYVEKIRASGYSDDKKREMLFQVRSDILDKLVDQKLTDQELKRYNINVTEKEIDGAIERIKERHYYTDEEVREALARQGSNMEEYRENIREQILRTKLVNIEVKSKVVITTKDVKSYYEKHADEYGGEKKYRLQNIIMKIPPFADKAGKAQIQNRMNVVLAKLKAGDSFEKMAGLYSESSGTCDLGLFSADELSQQLQSAIKGLKAGEFTSVLDTDHGYQIFYVTEVITVPGKSLEDARSDIEEKLFREIVDKKFDSWLDDLRKKSYIKIIK